MNKTSYKKYLKSKHWTSFRNTLKLDKYYRTCFICGYSNDKIINDTRKHQNTVLHHCNYKNLFWEKKEDVIPLCDECHKNLHMLCKVLKVNKKATNTKHFMSKTPFGTERKTYPEGFAFSDMHVTMKTDHHVRNIFN